MKKKLNAHDTALLVAELLIRSKKTRARLSGAMVQRLSGHKRLTSMFTNELKSHLDVNGIVLCELARGGFGLLAMHALEGAPTLPMLDYEPGVEGARIVVENWVKQHDGDVEDEEG